MSIPSDAVVAFIDESVSFAGEGFYLLGVVLVASHERERYRAEVSDLLLTRQRRLHWRDEKPARRATLARYLATSGIRGLVIATHRVTGVDQERARHRCVARLLWELDRRGVEGVVFESRERRLDSGDLAVVRGLRRAGGVAPGLRVEFARAVDESLLWLADIIAGMAATDVNDQSRPYTKWLGEIADTFWLGE